LIYTKKLSTIISIISRRLETNVYMIMKIIALSVFTVDYYPTHKLKRVGGNSANFAIECVRQGHEVSVLGAVGNDDKGSFIIEHLKQTGINTSHLYALPGISATNTLLHDANGDRYSPEGAWQGGVYENFRLSAEDWAYVNSFDLLATTAFDPNFPSLFDQLKPSVKIVVDFLHTGDFQLLKEHITRLDIAFFSGGKDLLPTAQKLAQEFDTLIVITSGAEGSNAFLGEQNVYQPAPVVEKVVDTTGCGDVFQAAFSLSWFKHNNIRKALEAGNEAASRIIARIGGC
jgi:fructoselysine 6-kinase